MPKYDHLHNQTMVVRGPFYGFISGDLLTVYLDNPLLVGDEAEFVCAVNFPAYGDSLVALLRAVMPK